ncbi:MAG: menaquinone biosynthesis protein [Vulcanimicrobiaceae bacterium]
MDGQLRCGRIVYTNDLPVYTAFDEGAITYPGTLQSAVPSELNAMLLSGELDVSPMSAFAYARHCEKFILLPDVCIGARREVISVVLVSQTPPALLEGATIAVTPDSASGVNLLRVLLERRYGVRAHFQTADNAAERARLGEPALLIGDGAIDAIFEFPQSHVYDLGTIWHDWTAEHTVFAVWAARREVYKVNPEAVHACVVALSDAYTWGRGHMETVVAEAHKRRPRPAGFYQNYYAKLNFNFHSAAQSGLAAYCRELCAIGAIPRMPQTTPEVIGVAPSVTG